MAGFAQNFQKLKSKGIIPTDTEQGDLNGSVVQAINGLTDAQIDLLEQIATTAQAHIFLHEAEVDPKNPGQKGKKGKIVAMGL